MKLNFPTIGAKWLLRFLKYWPPYWGAGIVPTLIESPDYGFKVEMDLLSRNKNYVGVHFGGSLYSMSDPFFMLILIHKLGAEYIVWDSWAKIKFVKPGKGKVFAEFFIADTEVEKIRQEVASKGVARPVFIAQVVDQQGNIVSTVQKGLWVSRKKK